jgi:predicted RNase H-like HicB family nuclease
MKQRTPQEKKALSYAKDRRNVYGESDKGSRIAIRQNKTFPTRVYRRTVNDILQATVGEIDLEKAELIDVKAKEIKRRRWKKFPDAPLGEYITRFCKTKVSYCWKIKNDKNDKELDLTIEAEQQRDGRWTAEVAELSNASVSCKTREEAIRKVKALALQMLPDGFKDDGEGEK